uniref:Uncharacterized protein n=1 Tax=Magallana gigas TaxID=29159 RepID=K1PH68_MAGGI
MADAWVDMNIRMGWKYGCTRGVSGTPLYAINGVVKVIDKAWSLTDWIGVLDPLVRKSSSFSVVEASSGLDPYQLVKVKAAFEPLHTKLSSTLMSFPPVHVPHAYGSAQSEIGAKFGKK